MGTTRISVTGLFLCLILLLPPAARAQSAASVSDLAGKPDAVVLEVPSDPCGALWDRAPQSVRAMELDFGPVALDHKALFDHYCGQKLGELSALVTAPYEDAKAAAQKAVEDEAGRIQSELTAGFWHYVAEILYDRLPPEEHAKYAPGSPQMDALAHQWLNDAPAEAASYATAYLTSGPVTAKLYEGWRIYADLTQGESRSILNQVNGLLDTAKKRLKQLTDAQAEIEKPDTSTTDALEKVGLSGPWMEKLKAHEGQLRSLNADYHIADAVNIVGTAMSSDVESDKIRAFFELMELSGAIASESRLPLVSFVGDIIQQYSAAANAMLDAVFALEQKIAERSGYCLGVGIASRDPRNDWFASRNILACPLSRKAWPFKHVYQSQGAGEATYYFYDGEGFITSDHGADRAGILAALTLIDAAADLGYGVTRDPDDRAARLGAVYNTAHPGGVPALMEEARLMVRDITKALEAVRARHGLGDACSEDDMVAQFGQQTGLSVDSFVRDTEAGSERMVNAIAASFVAFEGGFGPGVKRGANAYQTYDRIAKKARRLSVFILEARAADQTGAPLPYAQFEARVSGGTEVDRCAAQPDETTGRFTVFAMGGSDLSITLSAAADKAQGITESFDAAYFRTHGLATTGPGDSLFARASTTLRLVKEDEPEETQTPEPTPPETGDDDTAAQADAALQACADLNALLDQAANAMDSGAPIDKAALLAQVEAARADAAKAACDTEKRQSAMMLAVVLADAQEIDQRNEQALADCKPEVIAGRHATLERNTDLLDPALVAKLRTAHQALTIFAEGRQAYLDNRLDPAQASLSRAKSGLGQIAPYCAAYLERADQGLSNIANIRRLDGHLAEAATACNRAELERLRGLMAGETHPAFEAFRGRIATALSACPQAEDGKQADDEAPEASGMVITMGDPPAPAKAGAPAEEDAGQNGTDTMCAAIEALEPGLAAAVDAGDFGRAIELAEQADALSDDPARMQGCEEKAAGIDETLGYLRRAADYVAALDQAAADCDMDAIDALRAKVSDYYDPIPLMVYERAQQAQDCAADEAEESAEDERAVPAPAPDKPVPGATGEISAYAALKDATDRFRQLAAQSGSGMEKYSIGPVTGNATRAQVVHKSTSYSSSTSSAASGSKKTLHYEADVQTVITVTAYPSAAEARPTPRAGEQRDDAEGIIVLSTVSGVDGTARTSKGPYRIETVGKRLNFRAYTEEGESERVSKDGAFAATLTAYLIHQMLNPDVTAAPAP